MRIVLTLLSAFALIGITRGQSFDEVPITKEVIIDYSDSLVRTHVLLKKETIKTELSLTYYWHDKGILSQNMGDYTGELLHGEYLVFGKNKKLIRKGYFDKGIKQGVWKKWNEKGLLLCVEEYHKGKLHGEVILYDEYGNSRIVRNYRNGNLVEKEKSEKISFFKKEGKAPADSLDTSN